MPVKIENLANRPVLLRLNSGQTLHLAPHRTSGEVVDVEVERNAKVQKLEERRVIVLHKVEEKKRSTLAKKKNKAESTEGKK